MAVLLCDWSRSLLASTGEGGRRTASKFNRVRDYLELQAAGLDEQPGVLLADAGYWQADAIEAVIKRGIQTLIPPDGDSRSGPRPGRQGGRYEFARGVLASDRGKALYGRRQGAVESVFGQIKANRGFRGFQRRGRLAVRSEWRLVTATHNLLKLHRHRLATA